MSLDQIRSILNKSKYRHNLQFEQILGQGLEGIVTRCKNLQDGTFISLKLSLKDIVNEISILSSLPDHPHIAKYIDQIDCDEGKCLLQEYAHGQDLFSLMEEQECLNETQARKILSQLLNAIKHLHRHNIVHRDIKLENVIINDDYELKLIDFGLSVKIKNDSSLYDISGSQSYLSPEILEMTKLPQSKAGYGRPVDLWACGVVLYVLLSGAFPFWHEDSIAMFNLIRNCEWQFEEDDWEFISTDARDLISKLLTRNPKIRLTAEEALQHPWFNQLN